MKNIQLQQSEPRTQALKVRDDARDSQLDRSLIGRLIESLDENEIRYCHWKSNWRLDRWLEGEGDLDLLVARRDIGAFTAALCRLGFKRAVPPREMDLPAVVNFYGYDSQSGKIINVHAHFQLVFGHELTNNYRLPIEAAILADARRERGVFVASPEMELILFVIRSLIKRTLAESFLRLVSGKKKKYDEKISGEFNYLVSAADPSRLSKVLRTDMPLVDERLFEECLETFRVSSTGWRRIRARLKMKNALSGFSRNSPATELATRTARGTMLLGRKLLGRKSPKKNFEGGGMLLALIGGDGAGKTTCVNSISQWLSDKFAVQKVHFGKPPKSFATLFVSGALRIQKAFFKLGGVTRLNGGRLHNLRMLCTARDRYMLYKKVRRHVANGEIVIADRYPVPKIKFMDASRIPDDSGKLLSRIENGFYREMLPPDGMFVLRVEPDVAVARKTDEPARHVLRRSTELWNLDWEGSEAVLIDANPPLQNVLGELRKRVWESL